VNALDQARSAYAAAAAPIRTDRATEFDAFSRVTYDLRSAWDQRDTAYPALVAAIDRNRRLWSILATGVADQQNALPQDLRARLFYLAEFTMSHSRDVLRGKGDVGPLIDVNIAVMRGLRSGDRPG
jgi:flagellar protein FlaF